jgi:hypothetical protein
MDDILISGSDQNELRRISEAVMVAAEDAHMPLSLEKLAIAVDSVDTFNCHIEDGELSILDERMAKFVQDYRVASGDGQEAIADYISAISSDELARFQAML